MRSSNHDRFPTLRTEGAILPVDLLQRIAAGNSGLDGLTPASYHLIEGEKLNEATNRAWNRLLGVWSSFQRAAEKLPSNNPGVSVTLDRWLLPFWQELGYGRLLPSAPTDLDGKTYLISHLWLHTPIHLVGLRHDLDRRIACQDGASQPSPHSLVQEFLNRSEDRLWGFVTNGLRLRILRNNSRLTRQAYVEFDLQSMFEGKVYTDFALMWRLCHQSRVEAEKAHDCWLEQWSKAAQQQGLRVLDQLRGGVERAISALGRGFLSYPTNHSLREKLRAGRLDAQDYYRQLLRLVYRLLFLFVAEDRELLFDTEADIAGRDRYVRFYSTARLRRQAERLRGTQHADLFRILKLVMEKLESAAGCPELGLPSLGGFLFSPAAVPDLEDCQLANIDLLDAVRALALTSDGHVLRPVDYRNLGSEEFGSVYESLLELHPVLNAEAGTFELTTASGHERKTTGSYYTPTSLITCLLDSALEPVLDEAARQPDPEQAIRNLKVADPACGSGHFLIAAAHRIAKRLAAIRTGEEEPPPHAIRKALRDVIGHSIYGVDINPMAVELCKVALWMEALEPGKPLSFLDHHIQCGNSLLGATPALLAKGIPDEAFQPIEGDVKARCTELKKQNKRERSEYEQGQGYLFEPFSMLGNLPAEFSRLNTAPDDSITAVTAIQDRYVQLVHDTNYQNARLWADTWCAAFVWKKDSTELGGLCPTERDFRNVERHAQSGLMPHVRADVERLCDQYQFFHWHLAFPDVFRVPDKNEDPDNEQVGWCGGFDVVLGNPPWVRQEILKPVKNLLSVYPSFKGTADLSVFFLDRSLQVTSQTGRVALLTPNKWFKADYAEALRTTLRRRARVQLLVDFGHSRVLFPDADTFPAAVVLQPAMFAVPDTEMFHFVRAHDEDRERYDLADLLRQFAVSVPHANLRAERWHLEESGASDLLDRLLSTGTTLLRYVGRSPTYGVKTGFNEAFYLDSATRDAIVQTDPSCRPLIRKFLRGRDINRWTCRWDSQWHILIPSSQNHSWPWSHATTDDEAEHIFAEEYPSLHCHLKRMSTVFVSEKTAGVSGGNFAPVTTMMSSTNRNSSSNA